MPGLYLPGENGGTVVLHDLGDGRIGSVVLNTADNRNIRQETVINLDIPQLQNLQQDYAGQKLPDEPAGFRVAGAGKRQS